MIVAVIAIAGFVIGSRYVAAFQRTERALFDQPEFSAAVMLTCGRGFASPSVSTPALDRFLARTVDTFSCSDLTPAMRPAGLNFEQALYRYLMTAVSWQWRWSGISWSRLTPLFGIAFALTLCAAYGLFRLAGPPLAALAAVVPLAVSAHHLTFLPQLRDYAKAPFILLLLLITIRIMLPPLDRRRALALSAAFGVVLGIGFGFRNDLLIAIPPFAAAVAVCLPGAWRDTIRLKAGCLALAAVTFVACGWPILSAYRSGSNSGHVTVLGLMSTFDESLGVTRPIYSLGPHYLDGYAAMAINGYSQLHGGPFVEFVGPDYDRTAGRLVADVMRHWPADAFVRGLAATLKVLQLPFTTGKVTPATPKGLSAPWQLRFYERRQQVLRMLAAVGPWLVVLAVILLGAVDWRAGVTAILLLLYYGAYPSLQFGVRHYFHLEFIAWGALLFLAVRAVRFRGMSSAGLRNAAITAAVLVAVVFVPLWTLRAYQQRHAAALFEGYASAHRSRIAVDEVWAGHRAADRFDARYLALEVSSADCPASRVPITLRYASATPANDFTTVLDVTVRPDGPTWRLVPVFYNENLSHFSGIGLPAGSERCLKSVNRIDDLSAVPIYLDLELAPGWRQTSLFQRIVSVENDG